jgi:hypothetical protein
MSEGVKSLYISFGMVNALFESHAICSVYLCSHILARYLMCLCRPLSAMLSSGFECLLTLVRESFRVLASFSQP